MTRFKKLLSAFLAILMVVSILAGCETPEPTDPSTQPTQGDSAKGTYSVRITSIGGMAMEGVVIYIYSDSTLQDMVDFRETDENGSAAFDLPVSSDYAIVLTGVPAGYEVEKYYSFTGNAARIVLTSRLVEGDLASATGLGLGDVMYDFTVTTPGGEAITLSEVLAEKDVAILNFWYVECSACQMEFPYMQEAYEMYSDKVGIIAVDPLDENISIQTFQASMGLSFPMAACPYGYANAFGVAGYPTTVVIDRYGVICLVEAGALTSLRYWTSLFDHFTGDDYEQKLVNTVDDLLTQVAPTYEMDTSENISALINVGDIPVVYRPEEGKDAQYSWPFIATEKNGVPCLKASNQNIEGSYATIYMDVTLKAGQAIGFDYLSSTEFGGDILHVIVNDEAIYSISGYSDEEQWKPCYPWVAQEDGTYEVALCYLKDDTDNHGDDTVYIKDVRVIDQSEIDAPTYIPFYAASTEDGFDYTYADIVYNDYDGYYHVGSADGPLLLVEMMTYTQFNEEQTLWDLAYDGAAKDYYDRLVTYFSYASNSSLNGVCTVNYALGELLKEVAKVAGFNSEDENEWLKLCKYYKVYGSDDQLQDPILGLAPFSAYRATYGKDVPTNYFYYNRIIMPRGLLAEFVPDKSGVYRITARSETEQGTEGWIFDKDRNELYVYEMDERMYNDNLNVSMVFYMEAGEAYYIDIAFWDVYEEGYIYYDIEYIAPEYDLFRLASPGYFTYDTNATGDAMYYLIAGGIDVVLGPDGKYYEDKGLDANGNQIYGSVLYADFVGITGLFDTPISTVTGTNPDGSSYEIKGMIDKGGFDFSKTENDLYILGYLKQHDYDVSATDAYLRELWGDEYDGYAAEYQLEDVYAGRYHGEGEDYTEQIKAYLDDIITTGSVERQGCVVVTEDLAQLLQMLMDKYTFKNVEHSWTKLCYYYDHLGPEG